MKKAVIVAAVAECSIGPEVHRLISEDFPVPMENNRQFIFGEVVLCSLLNVVRYASLEKEKVMDTEPKADVLLYVEDEILIQFATVPALENAGFEVLVAHNGAEALDIIATEDGPIDGLVTDVNLGLGPNGWNVARSARERTAQMPILYASSVDEDEWMARGVPLSELVAKPYKPSRIARSMSKLIATADDLASSKTS